MTQADVDALVERWCRYWSDVFNVDLQPAFVHAIIQAESSGRPNVTRTEPNGHVSYGLMQLLDSTASMLGFAGDVAQLLDPGLNIQLGTKYLAQLLSKYGGQGLSAVASAYNAGRPLTTSTDSAGVPLSFRNQTYVDRVRKFFGQQLGRLGATVGGAASSGIPFVLAAAAAVLLLLHRNQQHKGL